jgi:hypothetical protein
MVVAGPRTRRRESATRASPHHREEEGLCQSAAPPGISRGARSGNRALRLLCALRAPAYEHPQRYLIFG